MATVLSIGERQWIAFARIPLIEPRVVFPDEGRELLLYGRWRLLRVSATS